MQEILHFLQWILVSYDSVRSEIDCRFHVCVTWLFLCTMGRAGFTECGALDYCHFPTFTKSWSFCFCFWRKSSFFGEIKRVSKSGLLFEVQASKRRTPGNLQKCRTADPVRIMRCTRKMMMHDNDDDDDDAWWWCIMILQHIVD